jgi:hypothetical protein
MQYQVSAARGTALRYENPPPQPCRSEETEQHVYTQLKNRHRDGDDREHDQDQSANMQVFRPMAVAVVVSKSQANLPSGFYDP